MGATILTSDELTMFKCSNELKSTKKYGNLYDCICKLPIKRTTLLDEIYDLNGKARLSLIVGKKSNKK